ncbi:TerC family protein [Meiothermus sp.]|uniref:TerC family protein n=1 Tax=Meiothermus sp. TaxID=1955249 RepID=UPI00307CF265
MEQLGQALIVIGILIVLEAVLSADNAMVLGVMVKQLPPPWRQRALFYGIAGAYILRGLALVFAVYLIQFWWIQALGAVYLLYIAIRHFSKPKPKEKEEVHLKAVQTLQTVTPRQFWTTVAQIELADLAFAVDSVLVAVALSDNLWIIFTGVFIGILALRFVAVLFVGLLEKYPRFEAVAFAVVGFAGVKLAIGGWDKFAKEVLSRPEWVTGIDKTQFSLFILVVLVLGTLWAMSQKPRAPQEPLEHR